MKRDSFIYRFVVLFIVYLFLVSGLVISLSSMGELHPALFWSLAGGSLLLFIIVVVVNEIIIRKKKKK